MDNPTTLKRPKPGDDEEELFRMQDEFLRNKQEPSAKVINLRGQTITKDISSDTSRTETNGGKIRSRFSELKKLKTQQERVLTSQSSGEVINLELQNKLSEKSFKASDDMVQNIPLAPSNIILGNIVEKVFPNEKYEFNLKEKVSLNSLETGFPKVFVSDYKADDTKQSLFWNTVSKKQQTAQKLINKQDNKRPIIKMEDGSVLIEGSWAPEIHKANVERLNEMSEEEILKEKSRLEATLTPDLIQFLKQRRNKAYQIQNKYKDSVATKNEATEIEKNVQSSQSKPTDNTSMDCEQSAISLPKPSAEILEEAKKKGWIHMDSLEPEKLMWMEDIPADNTAELAPDEPYNARFDFNGMLLPYKDEKLTIDKGLHHHGDEPERPGYSLQELLQLSRSATQQQRCTALTTLGNILEKSREGWYDKALHPAPLVALGEKNLLLLLRFSLDDTSVAVVTAALQALRAYLFSEADEICMDRLFGWNNYEEPVLTPPPIDVHEANNLKDHELAQLDAVAALMRSDVILRIRYILSEMHPPPIGVTCALEILICLARHSHITAINIACTPHLLEIIIQNFMPLSTDAIATSDSINNVYGVPVSTAVRLCRVLVCYGRKAVAEKLNTLKVIQSILSYISCDAGKHSINLTIEALRLWKMLLHYRVGVESVVGAQLTLLSQLQLLLSNHGIGNASELACEHATALIAVACCNVSLKNNISVLLSKWSTQLTLVTSPSWGVMKLIALTLLVSDYNLATERQPSSLPSFGVLTENGHLQPIVSQRSCIPFLAKVLNVFHEQSCVFEIQAILSNSEVLKYLTRLDNTQWSLERSWFTRTELSFLTAIVKGGSLLKSKLESETYRIIWKITVKLTSSLPADAIQDVKDVLRIALSNENLRMEIVVNELAKLHLDAGSEHVSIDIKHDIVSLYERYIASEGQWNQTAMPKDWLYLPVVHLYNNCKDSGNCSVNDRKTILVMLSLELILPDLVEQLSPTLRFSRLVLVYLCDTVYLNNDVSVLLSKITFTLLHKYHKKLDFATELPGLNSFTDLFTAMCENFCSHSYGDYGFSMVLLAPIAQRHDVHYRKLLWSEHAGVLRYLRLPLEKLAIPLKEYLYPVEKDTSLIESYLTALVRGTIKQEWCPILHMIAMHHSAMYLKGTGKLATRMRAQIENIQNKQLAHTLLCYEPPEGST